MTLSDERMDSLLQDFFRLEVPVELSQPFSRNPSKIVPPISLGVNPEQRRAQSHPRSVRLLSIGVAVASMGLAVAMIISGSGTRPTSSQSITNDAGKNGAEAVVIDQPMLVSPKGDAAKATNIVSPDGVTLEEADSIELHPRK